MVLDANLFAQIDPPLLAGSSCDECGVVVFPCAARCPRCAGNAVTRTALPARGTVWTWTTQAFPPKPPYSAPDSGFAEFVVGYVDLGSVLVESRLLGPVQIGDEVELRLLDLGSSEHTFAFEKVSR